MDSLPQELLLLAFGFLDVRSLLNLRKTCRELHFLASDPILWKELCKTTFHLLSDEVAEALREEIGAKLWVELYWSLSSSDLSITYRNEEKKKLGCSHYRRDAKLRATCCGKFFTCRFCHDKNSDHTIDRYSTREVMCMRCKTIQFVSKFCNSKICKGEPLARYFCGICVFYDHAKKKSIYHCAFCKLCRVAKEEKRCHCMKCSFCVSQSVHAPIGFNHRCFQKMEDELCYYCRKGLGAETSLGVVILMCGHIIHQICFHENLDMLERTTCPICHQNATLPIAKGPSPMVI